MRNGTCEEDCTITVLGVDNLKEEGICSEEVCFVSGAMRDTLMANRQKA